MSKVQPIYYSSLNMGNEIVNFVYKKGGNYKVADFLDHCEKGDWSDLEN